MACAPVPRARARARRPCAAAVISQSGLAILGRGAAPRNLFGQMNAVGSAGDGHTRIARHQDPDVQGVGLRHDALAQFQQLAGIGVADNHGRPRGKFFNSGTGSFKRWISLSKYHLGIDVAWARFAPILWIRRALRQRLRFAMVAIRSLYHGPREPA